jgi:hypothetical protein
METLSQPDTIFPMQNCIDKTIAIKATRKLHRHQSDQTSSSRFLHPTNPTEQDLYLGKFCLLCLTSDDFTNAPFTLSPSSSSMELIW